MFELASRLVGIYKVNHMTKSVTVENKDYLAMGRQGSVGPVQAQNQSQSQVQSIEVSGQGIQTQVMDSQEQGQDGASQQQ